MSRLRLCSTEQSVKIDNNLTILPVLLYIRMSGLDNKSRLFHTIYPTCSRRRSFLPTKWSSTMLKVSAEPKFVISQFRIYTPLEMRISTARSVRKRFCSFSFAGLDCLEFSRIRLIKGRRVRQRWFLPTTVVINKYEAIQQYSWGPSQLACEASLAFLSWA